MIDPKKERKMGSAILGTIKDIQETPKGNLKQFQVLKRRLERQVKQYTEYTGRDRLDPNVAYAYRTD